RRVGGGRAFVVAVARCRSLDRAAHGAFWVLHACDVEDGTQVFAGALTLAFGTRPSDHAQARLLPVQAAREPRPARARRRATSPLGALAAQHPERRRTTRSIGGARCLGARCERAAPARGAWTHGAGARGAGE